MFKLSLNRVRDSIVIVEGGERLKLYVDADPLRMTAGLMQAQKLMQGITAETTDEEQRKIASYFAAVVFGPEQGGKLMAFYHDDAACVFNVVGKYFATRLTKKITAAQKKIKT